MTSQIVLINQEGIAVASDSTSSAQFGNQISFAGRLDSVDSLDFRTTLDFQVRCSLQNPG
jgi:hypothetical protein